MKPPKCSARGCRNAALYFAPRTGLRKRLGWCSDECGVVVAMDAKSRKAADDAKRDKAEHIKRKRASEPIKKLLARVQTACNAYIHQRDYGKHCISCGKHCERMEAGHWKPVGRGGGSPARFEPDNIHLQCHPCNVHGGGGKHEGYLANLLQKIGPARVSAIEELHASSVKWNRDELETLRAWFTAETRRIRREHGR